MIEVFEVTSVHVANYCQLMVMTQSGKVYYSKLYLN